MPCSPLRGPLPASLVQGLPLFILANWRGFSGGQRDLFEGVLQVGGQEAHNPPV